MNLRQVKSQLEFLTSKNERDCLKDLYDSPYFLQGIFTAIYTLDSNSFKTVIIHFTAFYI